MTTETSPEITPESAAGPTTTLAKTFDPAAIEARWYAHWEDKGLFRPERPGAQPFTIVNPPPNVTGSLHIGHALDNTLQDVVVRYERLRGKDALWVVGTDHAGIATQMVVERQLEAQQDKRTNYSREDFIAKVWDWKHESGGTITGQLRRLGCSMDWSREQFTMDPHFSRAVTKVFVDLYNDGLIYRDKRLVNWDPKLKTAISDLEVETREVQGHMWHFKYPLAGGETYTYVERDEGGAVLFEEERDYISIATTRPETMLGDGAVAVHPGDERYRPIVGKFCEIPVGPKEHRRLIPIIADEYPDPAFGSGAVKITGAHDENDFQVAQRNGIPMYRLMDETATMRSDGAPYAETTEQARLIANGAKVSAAEVDALNLVPEAYRSLDRYEARKRVIADIDAEGLMALVEDKIIMQPFGDRGGVVIEQMLTDQWYVDAATLAQPPLEAVRDGRIEIVPKTWEKTFFNWMENIQPWCVSRQLWWGHRIPAWFTPNGTIYVAESEAEARALAGAGVELAQDPDVLDTWFSSALWPFATLGWPESSPSPDGEGDHAQHGGGVRYKLPVKTNAAVMRAKAMRRTMPPSETALWSVLKERPGGFKFRKQHPAGDYVIDFFCPAAGLAIEVDGEAHNRGDRPERDALRDAFLLDCGIQTLRVPAREVFSDVEAVVAGIVERARERLPLHHPADGPPPRQAGEDLYTRHYPNDLLISGFDILFFWDARMAMMGMKLNEGRPPWKRLYLHGLVRAGDGQKMSKSKGNVVDPLLLIDRFGADALRFFMAAMESQGRDIKIDEKRVEGYRNFATKLWNATRFCQGNGIAASQTIAAPAANSAVNRWIIGKVVETVAALDSAMADLRFDAAANAIYHFVWDTFCDWYIELIKGSFDEETRAVAGWVLDQILVMLHPFMPFVTEELWNALGERPYELIVAKWPDHKAAVDAEAKSEVEWLIGFTTALRSARAEINIAPGSRTDVIVHNDRRFDGSIVRDGERLDLLTKFKSNLAALNRMARVDVIQFAMTGTALDSKTGADVDRTQYQSGKNAAFQLIHDDTTYSIPLDGVIDIAAEKVRLTKALEASTKEAKALAGRLSNAAFVEKAKPEAVDKARADHAHHGAEAERLAAALARLG